MRPVRIQTPTLFVPGIIGMRDPAAASFSSAHHVLVGPDAGFPGYQSLDEWKGEVALVDARALAPDVRAAAGIKLPEEELAELDAFLRRETAEFDYAVPPLDDDLLSLTQVGTRARLHALSDDERRALTGLGVPFWVAGYTRYSGHLWLHRVGGPDPFTLWVPHYDSGAAGWDRVPPRLVPLVKTRWPDRVFRALSGGAVTEPALLFARRYQQGWSCYDLVEDDIALAAVESAARIAAGDDIVDLPLVGRVHRVVLSAFTLDAFEVDPFAPGPHPIRTFLVPEETVYTPVAAP